MEEKENELFGYPSQLILIKIYYHINILYTYIALHSRIASLLPLDGKLQLPPAVTLQYISFKLASVGKGTKKNVSNKNVSRRKFRV